jgi:uncharacterized protein
MTLDEVPREPDLILAIKSVVDRQPLPVAGQFVLTGSANLLMMKQVGDSLAGRAYYLQLWPMTRREQHGLGTAGRTGASLCTVEVRAIGWTTGSWRCRGGE